MCRVLEVSRSGYYAWLKRETSDRTKANAALLKVIQEIHEESDGTYGAPRIHAELEERGPQASLNRVARVMREAEIQGVSPRKWTHTTLRAKRARPAPDLVDRDFTATGPDQLWVADITYISTWAGFLFLAVVLDVWSRRIVGWAMATHLRTELVLDALDMALARRRPRGVIHHSDQGCQPRFKESSQRIRIDGSLGSPVSRMVRGQGRGRPDRAVLLMLSRHGESEATKGRRSKAAEAMKPS
jgi:putative transposase